MKKNTNLNDKEIKCLEKLINITYSTATENLNNILEKNINLGKPKIEILSLEEFNKYLQKKLNNKIHYKTSQIVNGCFNTENIFLMDKHSVYNLANILSLKDIEKQNINDLQDLVLEISNILTVTIMSNLGDKFNTHLQFERPDIQIVNSIEKYNSNTHHIEYDQVIIISTDINFDKLDIQGELLFLSNDDTIVFIKNKLNELMKDFCNDTNE